VNCSEHNPKMGDQLSLRDFSHHEGSNGPMIDGSDLKNSEHNEISETEQTLAKQQKKIEELKASIGKMRQELNWEHYEVIKDNR
jgi:hypothetical protein